jgi:carbamoyl-phosphate synthase small subunit
MAHVRYPVFSVQYHPEASPGPHDASYMFGRFIDEVNAFEGASALPAASSLRV